MLSVIFVTMQGFVNFHTKCLDEEIDLEVENMKKGQTNLSYLES